MSFYKPYLQFWKDHFIYYCWYEILSPILAPILFSLFIAVLCLPMLRWLQNRRIPTWFALLLILLGLFIFIALVFLIVYISLSNLDERLPTYQK